MNASSFFTECTQDVVARGQLTLWQPKQGYRFSLDPLLLADFVGQGPYGSVVDLGAGVGIVGLLLGKKDPASRITLVELQTRMAQLCVANAQHNGMTNQTSVLQGDITQLAVLKQFQCGSYDWVVSCPPYYRLGQGGINPNTEEAIARHEVHLPLHSLVASAKKLLRFRGHAAMIYPANRLSELLTALPAHGLQPIRLRLVYPKPHKPAQRVLMLACKGSRAELVIDPPFFVREETGIYSSAASRALGE